MRVLVDADVFIAVLQAEPEKGEIARELLNSTHYISTSTAVLMEIRTVLAKKKAQPMQKVASALDTIRQRLDYYITSVPSFSLIDNLQKETLLYPMDCIHYSTAMENELILASFDSELQGNGAISPSDLI